MAFKGNGEPRIWSDASGPYGEGVGDGTLELPIGLVFQLDMDLPRVVVGGILRFKMRRH